MNPLPCRNDICCVGRFARRAFREARGVAVRTPGRRLIYDRTSQNMCPAVTPSLSRAKRCHRSNFYQQLSWEAAKSGVGTLSTGANHNLGAAVRYVMRLSPPPPFCRVIAITRRALAGLFAAPARARTDKRIPDRNLIPRTI